MVLKLEECVDCLKVLAPHFDYLFLFDHFCGHDKQREERSKHFGGKQAHLHDSFIKESEGYLGLFPKTLRPGDIQSMVFQHNDPGSFWLSAEERLQLRNNEILPGKKSKGRFRKDELVKMLVEAGGTATGNYAANPKACIGKKLTII